MKSTQGGRRIAACFAISPIFVLSLLCAAQTGKIESIGPLTDSSVPGAVRQTLDAKGYRITLDEPVPACELWIRQGVPALPNKDIEGLAYPQLAESTLVGVIHFSQPAADFRGQRIRAGFYTLRYELIPNDGNHLGVAPNRDFLLLVPAASDADPKAQFKFEELVALSREATGTKHPGPLSLAQANGMVTAAAISKDDQDHWIFSAPVKLASGDEIPMALVVKGRAQQ
jgi:hypothetical protein